jgi:hypothetical protein
MKPILSKDSYWLSSKGKKVIKFGNNRAVHGPSLLPQRPAIAGKVGAVQKKAKKAKLRIGVKVGMSRHAFQNILKEGK